MKILNVTEKTNENFEIKRVFMIIIIDNKYFIFTFHSKCHKKIIIHRFMWAGFHQI